MDALDVLPDRLFDFLDPVVVGVDLEDAPVKCDPVEYAHHSRFAKAISLMIPKCLEMQPESIISMDCTLGVENAVQPLNIISYV